MKKTCLVLTLLLSVCCAFVFAGCSLDDYVKSVSVIDNGEAITVELGKFNYDDYKINVVYANGNTQQVAMSEDMISAYDKLKFYQVGEQTIKITYQNCNCDMKINVIRASLNNIEFESENIEVVYTGKPYVIEVQGEIPADVNIFYPNGNSFTNAGTYPITAKCYGDNYETKTLSTTLTIKQAKYDMSKVEFKDANFVYDKNPKTLAISGTLPEGVNVSYKINNQSGNSATNAGTYQVVASFSSKNANYEPIQDKTALLIIDKAKFDDFDIKLTSKNEVYSGHEYSIDADLKAIPKGVSAYYTIQQIKNAKGENVQKAEESGNSATLAGTYIVRVNFVVSDSKNYQNIAPKSATLFVDRAVYEIDNAFMYGKSVVYDGLEKSISLSGESMNSNPVLPAGVEYTYTIKMIQDALGNDVDGERQSGNSAINAGKYEITAHLTSNNENYKEIRDITGILEITQAEYKELALTMTDLTAVYDGNAHSIEVTASNLPQTVTIVYTIRMTKTSDGTDIVDSEEVLGNSAINAGTYEIRATFVNSDNNYSEISSITAVLVISGVK